MKIKYSDKIEEIIKGYSGNFELDITHEELNPKEGWNYKGILKVKDSFNINGEYSFRLGGRSTQTLYIGDISPLSEDYSDLEKVIFCNEVLSQKLNCEVIVANLERNLKYLYEAKKYDPDLLENAGVKES